MYSTWLFQGFSYFIFAKTLQNLGAFIVLIVQYVFVTFSLVIDTIHSTITSERYATRAKLKNQLISHDKIQKAETDKSK